MPRSILIADSNFGFAGMLQQATLEAGFSCQTAVTAREAINMASSSQVSLAINKDPEAPIFGLARFGVVSDMHKFVPALTAELKKRLGR